MWFGLTNPAHQPGTERIFNVYCNGRVLLENLNVTEQAGGENRPLLKIFHNLTPDPQGKLVFSFEPVRNYATINAIEIVPEPLADVN
jgi:hypothetical protein